MDYPADESLSTEALLERARQGDQEAFAELFRQYLPRLRPLVEKRLDPRLDRRVDASDIMQEVQIEAWQRFDGFLERKNMRFDVWLRQTTLQCMALMYRHHLATKKRSISNEVEWPDQSSVLVGKVKRKNGSTAAINAKQEAFQQVAAACLMLDEEDRELMRLRHVEGLTFREIGERLDITEQAAHKRYGKVVLRIQKIIKSL